MPVLSNLQAESTVNPAATEAQIGGAIERIKRGVPGMQTKCSYASIANPTHLVVVLRQTHEFAPSEVLSKRASDQSSASLPGLDAMRRELLQATVFLRQEVSLKHIFCEAVSADQLPELNSVAAELKTKPSLARGQELRSRIGVDFWKCELVASSGLLLHAAESRELNKVVSELSEKGSLVAKEAQRMSEMKVQLEKQYPRRQDIPEVQQRAFIEVADRVIKASERFVAFWNDPLTRQGIFEKRERFALDQMSRLFTAEQGAPSPTNSCPGAVLLYGGNHDFKRHLAAIHQQYPTLRVALIELTPESYREPPR
jgi:polyhydroxyalkanoate synthesis regulator phasin